MLMHEIDPTIDSFREGVMGSVISIATYKGSIKRSSASIYYNGKVNDYASMIVEEAQNIIAQDDDSRAAFILGIGDALVDLDMIQGPISTTSEVFEEADRFCALNQNQGDGISG